MYRVSLVYYYSEVHKVFQFYNRKAGENKMNKPMFEVQPSHYDGLAASALRGILPRIKGNLIQESGKTFLERKVPSFFGRRLGIDPILPEEFIVE